MSMLPRNERFPGFPVHAQLADWLVDYLVLLELIDVVCNAIANERSLKGFSILSSLGPWSIQSILNMEFILSHN